MSLGFTQAGRKKSQDFAEREVLLAVLNQQNEIILAAVEELNAVQGEDRALAAQYCQKVIDCVDTIEAAGDWESSLFLRNIIKPIKQVREDAQALLAELADAVVTQASLRSGITENQQLLFISLFQAKGNDMAGWQLQLRSIDRYWVGRPVYEEESCCQKVLRIKDNTQNEAYAAVIVDKEMIQSSGEFDVERKDRYGNILVMLKPNAITADQVIEFFHEKKRYSFKDGRLSLLDEG